MRRPTAKYWIEGDDSYVDLREKLKALKWIGTPQKYHQGQLTWTPGRSQTLSHQPKAYMGWTKSTDTYVEDMQLRLLVGPLTTGVEVLPKAVA